MHLPPQPSSAPHVFFPQSGLQTTQALLAQTCPIGHVPQRICPLHPSETLPHVIPAQARAAVAETQTHAFATQICPVGQPPSIVPHAIDVPQPLSRKPQFFPVGHVVAGEHVAAQVPLAQIKPAGQRPQLSVSPHPLSTVPQSRTPQAARKVSGAQPQTFGLPAPPHELGGVQSPVLQRPPHPSLSPHDLPLQFAMHGAGPASEVSKLASRGRASASTWSTALLVGELGSSQPTRRPRGRAAWRIAPRRELSYVFR